MLISTYEAHNSIFLDSFIGKFVWVLVKTLGSVRVLELDSVRVRVVRC